MSNELNEQQTSKKLIIRKATSIILVLAFFVLAVTGVQMNLSHNGRGNGKHNARGHVVFKSDALSNGPSIIREVPFYPKEAHKWAGYLFIVAGCLHVIINIKALKSFVGIKR